MINIIKPKIISNDLPYLGWLFTDELILECWFCGSKKIKDLVENLLTEMHPQPKDGIVFWRRKYFFVCKTCKNENIHLWNWQDENKNKS